jgi:hypothetical protein
MKALNTVIVRRIHVFSPHKWDHCEYPWVQYKKDGDLSESIAHALLATCLNTQQEARRGNERGLWQTLEVVVRNCQREKRDADKEGTC